MFSTFTVFVITRDVKIKTTNPMSDRKPPRAILKRCLRLKYDIAFFSLTVTYFIEIYSYFDHHSTVKSVPNP